MKRVGQKSEKTEFCPTPFSIQFFKPKRLLSRPQRIETKNFSSLYSVGLSHFCI